MTPDPVTAHDLARICRVSYRQLDYWTKAGYVQAWPSKSGRSGSGFVRLYPPEEVWVARVIACMVHAGFTAGAAGNAAQDAQPTQEGFWVRVATGTFHGRLT